MAVCQHVRRLFGTQAVHSTPRTREVCRVNRDCFSATSLHRPPLPQVRLVGQDQRPGHVLGLEELNALAVAMADPRQCGRCGFGPVDHAGCSDLRYHHLEVSMRGGSRAAVSNACPRCGWFTGRLQVREGVVCVDVWVDG